MSRALALRFRAAACALFAALALAALVAAPAGAQIVRAFTPRYSTNDNGDVVLIGNTLMSCSGNGQCPNGRNGTGNNLNNNDFNMVYVDVDADGTTNNSSRATLALPAGATVLWAGLYWSGDSNAGARNTVRFSTPVAAYATLTATRLDASGTVYQGFVEVTARVQTGGNGTYTVASVQSTTGTNEFAGWGLVVVYRLASDPPRNLVVFDGYGQVAPGATQTITVSGFLTPPAGPIATRLGVIAGEGDLGFTGDVFRLNGTALTDAANPANNFFNSSISSLGASVTTKTPNYVNQLGWDVDRVSANGVLPNGATSATITLSSTNDRYYPGVVTFATDLYQPILSGNGFTKTVTDVNGGAAQPGDALEYLVTLTNTGNDASANTVVQDTIPANAVYVPGSIVIVSGPNAGAKSDAAGDDQAEYDAATRRVIARLGTGANAASGGRLAPAAATSVRFRVTVGTPIANGAVVSNQAVASFNGEQLGTPFVTQSDGDAVTAGIQRTDITVTVPPSGATLSGFAYSDLNHSAFRDGAEPGTGAGLWVKLVAVSAPGVAQAVAAVDAVSGAFAFTFVAPGSYTLVLDDNSAPADVAPALPAGWLGTEHGSGSLAVTLAALDIGNLNFGLWHGSRIAGRVFRDDGAAGGIANDGVAQAGESGVAGARVLALSAACAAAGCDSAWSDGAGNWTLWIPSGAAGTLVSVRETNLAGWVSTGGGAGTTGGAYARATDEVSFVAASGVAYAALAFGDVPGNAWGPGGTATVFPGDVATYAHTFTAGSAGTLTLGASETPAPAIPGWNVTLVRDLDCDGVMDAGEPAIAAPLALAAGQSVCVIARHASPAGAPNGASESVTITAAFDYTGAAPALAVSAALTDLTTVGDAGSLRLVKSADVATAPPGGYITYTLAYSNPGPAPLTSIEILDATPAFTVFDSGGCGTLGAGLGGCALTTAPASGAAGPLRWTLSGALAPGGSGSVTFRVRVQ